MLLRQLVAELSIFSHSVPLLGGKISPYDHDGLWKCFSEVTAVAHRLINEIYKGLGSQIPLDPVPHDVIKKYFTKSGLGEQFFATHTRYYLAIKKEKPSEDLGAKLQNMRIASEQDIVDLVNLFVSGVQKRYREAPPKGVTLGSDYGYFELLQEGEYWDNIKKHQNIAVWCPLSWDHMDLQLWGIKEDAG
jgi:type VI secretion system protein ImpJ